MAFEFGDIPIVGPLFDPKKPGKVTDTPAYKATENFANGIQNQRSGLAPTPTPTIAEGTAPTNQNRGQSADQLKAQADKIKAQMDALPRDRNGKLSASDEALANQLADQWHSITFDQIPKAQQNPPDNNTYIDPTGRDAQKRALGLDETAATGLAPSAAENLFRKGIDEGQANQLATAATLQGSNPGMAMRQGLRGAADVATGSSAAGAALRADEMAKARSQFDAASATTRGQTQDLAKANQDAALRQQLIDHQYELGLTDEQLKALMAEMGGSTTDTTNQNNFNMGQQQFWADMVKSGGKAAAAGG